MEQLLQYSGSGRWKRERKRAFLLCNQTWIKFIKDAASPFKWLATVFLNSKELVGDTAPFWFRLKITEKSLLKWKETWILFLALWLKWASQTCTQCIQGPKEGRKVLRGTENWGARVWSGRSCEGARATQIKCVSPRDRLPSSVDMPAVRQTELEVASCHPGLAASGMQGPGGQSITEHTWSAQRRQWGGRWLGGERMAGGWDRELTPRQDLRPPGAFIQGVYIIYQCGKGDRLGWSGLLTLQLLSVFIELDAWAFRPQHSHFKMGMLTQIQVVNGLLLWLKIFFLRYEDLVCTHLLQPLSFFGKTLLFLRATALCVFIKDVPVKEKFWKSVSSPNTFLRWIPTWEEKMAIQGHGGQEVWLFQKVWQ